MSNENKIIDLLSTLHIRGLDKLQACIDNNLTPSDMEALYSIMLKTHEAGLCNSDRARNIDNLLEVVINSAIIIVDEIGMKRESLLALLLYQHVEHQSTSVEDIADTFGEDVAKIVRGLLKTYDLEVSHLPVASENYIKLLLVSAEDLRVIPIKIASRLYMMRIIDRYHEPFSTNLVVESSYIYSSFAHKLGLHKIKTELEDLCLKYTDRKAYDYVEKKISESKEARDHYIKEFVDPIEKKLKETNLKFDIKWRTKSIASINNKLRKQKIDFESIYDLFAIRIVIDAPMDKEKAECWQVYSIVTDLYMPNPIRLKDWLSIPKSNGYESLHITVMGPESRWVEVQIRTRRMDEIAEYGLAAHWKYKGLKSQSRIDDWLISLRETLENEHLEADEKLERFRLDQYDDEIYVFTPKGDLHKLPQGATVLDFAFSIHTRIGSTCVSGKVNNKNVPIRYRLNNGDQVEIITSPNQLPKQDWLGFVSTSKAKSRIRQSLKEEANKQVDIAKEMLKRRVKNKKMEIDESIMMRLIKKLGFKNITSLYVEIAEGRLDVNDVLEKYSALEQKDVEHYENYEATSAEKYQMSTADSAKSASKSSELVIGQGLTGVDYKLAICCNPIFGDEIFGFISTQGIRIHRRSCTNAKDMFSRFGYRVIPARWAETSGSSYIATLRIVGADDIGIINNLTSIISKESGVSMRSISIDSDNGIFQGSISVMLSDTTKLNSLLKKLKGVKGVKDVERVN